MLLRRKERKRASLLIPTGSLRESLHAATAAISPLRAIRDLWLHHRALKDRDLLPELLLQQLRRIRNDELILPWERRIRAAV